MRTIIISLLIVTATILFACKMGTGTNAPITPPLSGPAAGLFSKLPGITGFLVLLFVGGIIAAYITEIKKLWIIPVAAFAGMGVELLMAAFVKAIEYWSYWVVGIVIAIGFILIGYELWLHKNLLKGKTNA